MEDICSHVLIMNEGWQRYFGTIESLRTDFAAHGDASLEDVFFQVARDEDPQTGERTADRPATGDTVDER